jgi:V8-like Glu-specific endopeptidase
MAMKRVNLLLAIAFFAFSAGGTLAQSASVMATAQSAAAVRAFWTPARLAAAKPMRLSANVTLGAAPSAATLSGPQVSRASAPPTSTGAAVNEFLYKTTASQAGKNIDVTPLATSSFGAHFTTSRVFPDSSTVAFPWRAAGKLFFHDPRTGGNFICSASVLRQRIIATAGHCVFHAAPGTANDYAYNQFLFVPAFRQIPPATAVAPFCSWTAAAFIVASPWKTGNGTVPNSQDVALLEANDRTCTAGSIVQKLGAVTGHYGYATNALIPQSITQIGYPSNLDKGLRMEVTWAQSFQKFGNTVVIGSAQRGGASGGPWLRNFGVQPSDSAHSAVVRNQLVSVTSYGPMGTEPQYLGGSILNPYFISILSSICAHRTGNC